MSLQIKNLHIIDASVKAQPPAPRVFSVSPAISGNSTWNLDSQGKINLGTYGTWTITPQSTFTASVKMWGAGGNGKGSNYGGAGGFSSGSISFEQDVPYVMLVGQGGVSVVGNSGTRVLGGGAPGRKISSTNACGGGLSGIFSGSYTQANSIMIAGGGGGGQTGIPGAGGGLTGGNGLGGSTGGTQIAGGSPGTSGGTGEAGSALLGGRGSSQAGSVGNTGAGGGYFGGGGGDGDGNSSSGGSGYVHPTKTIGGITVAGSGSTPANSSDVSRGNAGGSTNNHMPGNPGRVIIS